MPDHPEQREDLTGLGKAVPDPGARVFFALWPEMAVRRRLERLAGQVHKICGGRRMRAGSFHLTLVFVGQVAPPGIETLKAMASAIRVPSFDLDLDCTGYWKENRIAWLGTRHTPRPLAALVENLEEGLRREGFRFDERPYFPHLTLVRKAFCGATPLPDFGIRWRAKEFALVRSLLSPGGAAYEIIGRWSLR